MESQEKTGTVRKGLDILKLMAAERDYSVKEIAEIMGTSSRAIYRYIDTFKKTGYAIYQKAPGIYKVLKYDKSKTIKNTTVLTQEEKEKFADFIKNCNLPAETKKTLEYKLVSLLEFPGI